jgi:hypothetical protein
MHSLVSHLTMVGLYAALECDPENASILGG